MQPRRCRSTSAAARPSIQPFAELLTTLDPFAPAATLPVVSVGHRALRVRTYAVGEADWAGFPEQANAAVSGRPDVRNSSSVDLPYELVDDRTVDVAGDVDAVSTTEVALDDPLAAHDGRVVVRVDPGDGAAATGDFRNQPTVTWVQRTTLGVDVASDTQSMHVFVTDLRTGAAVGGAAVDALGPGGDVVASATTVDDGTATIELPDQPIQLVRVTAGDATALAPSGNYGGPWQRAHLEDQTAWYVFADRGVYRPGETVSLKGWVRRVATSGDARIELPDDTAVGFTAHDGNGNEIATGTAEVDPLGGFHLTFAVPPGANAGMGYVAFDRDADLGQSFGWGYRIDDYRTPEFEVTSSVDGEGPYVRGAPLGVTATAGYFAGGALPDAPVDWQVSATATTYSPPGWDGFDFGRWTPWWTSGPAFAGEPPSATPVGVSDQEAEHFAGSTDGAGADHLQVDVGSLGGDLDGYPVAVSVHSTVTDVNRQAWSSTTNTLVHPAQRYVGLRTPSTFVGAGVPLAVDVIVTDVDGAVVAGVPVTLVTSRMESGMDSGVWTERAVDPQTCSVTSAAAVVTCQVRPGVGGTYQIVATVTDEQGRPSRTELTRWVGGAGADAAPRTVDAQSLTVVPDGRTFAPGGTARLLVRAPFADGEGLLTTTHGTITGTYRFTVADGSAVVDVPIAGTDVPGIDVVVEVVGVTARTGADGAAVDGAPPRPAYATGQVHLPVSLAARTLTVHAVPRAADVQPGGGTVLDVDVTDATGAAVAGADLAVVVVDEAALAVSGYELPDPLDAFYADLPGQLQTTYGRSRVVLADPAELLAVGSGMPTSGDQKSSATTAAAGTTPAAASAPSLAGGVAEDRVSTATATGSSTTPIDVRTDFAALAVWAPSVATDGEGRAAVDVDLPDNLTRYRVMVVAAGRVRAVRHRPRRTSPPACR